MTIQRLSKDYGYYGVRGEFSTEWLPMRARMCDCGGDPVVRSEYDDTPGFRDTTYEIYCPFCKLYSYGGTDILKALEDWNAGRCVKENP